MKDLFKKAAAECLGTFVLVFFACGVAAFTGGELVATSLAFGLVIVAMAYSVGRISGCHINPAVSIAMLISKKMSLKEFCVYVCSQIVGGLVGAVAIFGFAKMAGKEIYAVGGIGDASNYILGWNAEVGLTALGVIGALLVEVVLTFVFVYVILNVTDENKNGAGKKAGLLIGLTLTLVHLLGINLTGTSVNPARSIATALGAFIYTGNAAALSQVWIFILAPLVGGLLAALVFKLLHSEKEAPAEETK